MPLSMKRLLALLLCCLEISLAGAVDDSMATGEGTLAITLSGANLTQQYEYMSGWDWLSPSHAQDHPEAFASSAHSGELRSLQFSLNDLFLTDEREDDIQFLKSASSNYSHLPKISSKEPGGDGPFSRAGLSQSSPELQFIQRSDKAQERLLDYSTSLGMLKESDISFVDEKKKIIDSPIDMITGIWAPSEGEFEGMLRTSDSNSLKLLDPERVAQFYETSLITSHIIGTPSVQAGGDQALNPFISPLEPRRTDGSSKEVYSYFPERLPKPRNKKELKNYAIVVGIDQYNDRMRLRTCANDARSMADLMREMGYDVLLFSDQTDEKPTKENILKKAFDEIRAKPNVGNVIFYFSGHGTKEGDDSFYLIPRDADGHISTYISEAELREQIADLKNFAMIIDACNSEGMSRAIGKDQLIIASSRYNESSNGEWTGSMSVFTSYLIKAIREEKERSNRVLLKRCFDRARADTERWSRSHLISQNPAMIDNTDGIYYIN